MGNRNPLLEAALTYAARGWPVFPCREKDGEPYLDRDGKLLTPREKQPYTTHSDRPTCPPTTSFRLTTGLATVRGYGSLLQTSVFERGKPCPISFLTTDRSACTTLDQGRTNGTRHGHLPRWFLGYRCGCATTRSGFSPANGAAKKPYTRGDAICSI